MKKYIACLTILLGAVASHGQKKQGFSYPANLPDSSKKSFAKQFAQGRVLYTISCGKCHDKTIDGKLTIPDFSLPQLMDYELRMYPQHAEKLDDRHVRDEDMVKIVHFLRYKDRTGLYVTPPAKQP